MKAIIIVTLAGLIYGLGKLTLNVFKEFAEIMSEAWRAGEAGH